LKASIFDVSFLILTIGAEMCASAAYNDSFNRLATAKTRFSRTPKNCDIVLHASLFTVWFQVTIDRSSFALNTQLQGNSDALIEPVDLHGLQRICTSRWVNSRIVQRFIRVDVADTCDHRLIK
jgi:hypothetical protein